MFLCDTTVLFPFSYVACAFVCVCLKLAYWFVLFFYSVKEVYCGYQKTRGEKKREERRKENEKNLSENERREEKSLAHAFLFRAGTTFVVKKLNGH